MKKKTVLGSIFVGIVKGFPLLNTIRQTVIARNGDAVGSAVPDPANPPAKEVNIVSVIAELVTIGLVLAFVFNKITLENLRELIAIINGQ